MLYEVITLFKEHVGYAQRMMDDIIDLELEKIDAILEKVKSDPESDTTKRVERELWENIRQKADEGRRTGVGITAEGDMLAALNLTYGSDIAVDFSIEVHKTLALAAYRASVEMAKDRGSFKIYDSEKEKNNPLIRITSYNVCYTKLLRHSDLLYDDACTPVRTQARCPMLFESSNL